MLDYYKLIRNSVQLLDVELLSSESSRNEDISGDISIGLQFFRKVKIVDKENGFIYLKTILEGKMEEETVFSFNVEFKGYCINKYDCTEQEFEKYLYDQVVPLMLPYAREFISSAMTRMNLKPYYVPTMDVLVSLKANQEGDSINEQE